VGLQALASAWFGDYFYSVNPHISSSKPHTMKQLLVASNLVTLALLGIMWLNACSTTDPCPATSCYSVDTNHLEGVTLDYAKSLVNHYREKQWTALRGGNTQNEIDARSAWFSLDTLKRFIHEIEQSACSSCGDSLRLGVRIYYGTYPETNQWVPATMAGVNPKYAGHHTLLMVPTYWEKQDLANIDFDPRHASGSCIPSDLRTIPGASAVGFLEPTSFMNHGGNWPPPYDNRFEPHFDPNHIVDEGTRLATLADQAYFGGQ
jgi:hypothetical protein